MKGRSPVPSLGDIAAAAQRLGGVALRTPSVPLEVEAAGEIYLKLENLQPAGSFKVRGASNALLAADPDQLSDGVWTASAGNMGLGLAWCARRLGVRCTVLIPQDASPLKREALVRLGATVVEAPVAQWIESYRTRRFPGLGGLFIHAFADPAVIAGNGVIGIELLEDLPDLETVFVPWGGGGLACGIAAALRALKPSVKVYACEVADCAPLAASMRAGAPVTLPHVRTFADGIGAPWVAPEMFDAAADLVEDSIVIGLDEVAAAIRVLLERNRVVAEGAAATAVAAALSAQPAGTAACIVSGGNLDADRLGAILDGRVPE